MSPKKQTSKWSNYFLLTSLLQLVTWKTWSSLALTIVKAIEFNKIFDNFAILFFMFDWAKVKHNVGFENFGIASFAPVIQRLKWIEHEVGYVRI